MQNDMHGASMSARCLLSTMQLDNVLDGHWSWSVSVEVDMLMQGQSQAWCVQGMPAEQEPGTAPGGRGA